MNELEVMIAKTKLAIAQKRDSAFLTNLLFQLPIVLDTSTPTAYTDGLVIGVNPEFFKALTPNQRIFLFLHETLHVAYVHALRKGDRNHQKWNIACDYVINDFLIKRGYDMPKNGLHNSKYSNWSSEQVYDALEDDVTEQKDIMYDLVYSEDTSSKNETEQKVKQKLAQALTQTITSGKTFGHLPQDLERFINSFLKPKVNWKTLLKRYMTSTVKQDNDWSRPNRRHQNIYLPTTRTSSLGEVMFAIDTSGSITKKQFTQILSEIASSLKQVRAEQIELLQFDSIIQSKDTIQNLATLKKTTFKGGGGTNIYPVIDAYNQSRNKLLVVLTDGYFDYSTIQCSKNILWLIFDGSETFQPTKGKVIHIQI